MGQHTEGNNKGYVATAALGEGVIVKIASGQVVVATAAGDKFIGVTVGGAVAAGETGSIKLRSSAGTAKVKAGGTIAVGDYLTSNATGLAIVATAAIAGAVPLSEVLGMAVEAGVANDFIEVALTITRV